MNKYKNEDGIELSYTQRNNVQTDLVKEVISESIKILGMCDKNCKISMGIAMSNTKKFLKTNFNIEEDKQQEQSFEDNDNNIDMIGL